MAVIRIPIRIPLYLCRHESRVPPNGWRCYLTSLLLPESNRGGPPLEYVWRDGGGRRRPPQQKRDPLGTEGL